MTPEDRAFIMEHTYRVQSPCGRVWDVPMRCVMNDYVRFLVDNDGVTRQQALADMEVQWVESWFHEQYDWQDVERDGKLVQQPTANQIKQALDLMRGGASNIQATTVDTPGHAARKKRRSLWQIAQQNAPAPAPAGKLKL
jgi:hypothetical protein